MSEENFFNLQQFPNRCKLVSEMIVSCRQKMHQVRVNPQLQHGFLRKQLGNNAPQESSSIQQIIQETQSKIFPGILHWQSPKFFAYFPATIAETTIYAQMFLNAFSSPGFTFSASPSHTELENIVVDWIVKAFNLPLQFLLKNRGGGAIMNTASDGIFMTVHAAKVKKLNQLNSPLNHPNVLKLVGYYSETAHAASERALLIKDIPYRRAVPSYFDTEINNYLIDLKKLEQIIQNDVKEGLIPFWYGSSIGTTFSGAVDQIQQISKICKKYNIWLNVDAAFIGTSWVCEDLRENQKGLELVDSLCFNFSKLLFSGFPGCLLYLADKKQYTKTLGSSVEFSFYNKYSHENDVIDYKDWQIGLARRYNSLKIYYLLKFYGLKKIRESFYSRIEIAKYFENLIVNSKHFELFSTRSLFLVCFRFKYGDKNDLTKKLSGLVKDLDEGYISTVSFKQNYILRFVAGNMTTTFEHALSYFNKITQITQKFVIQNNVICN